MFSLKNLLPTVQRAASERPSQEHERLPVRRPMVTITESDKDIILVADMPGVTQDKVEVTVNDNVMTVRGVRAQESHDGFSLLHREYHPVSFEQSLSLPNDIAPEKITATIKHGVVTINVPKAAGGKARRIAVSSG